MGQPVTSARHGQGAAHGAGHPSEWFDSHFDGAVQQIESFLGGDGLSLRGLDVADVGCGDGIIDVGIAVHLGPRSLVGFDITPVDVDHLAALIRTHRGLDLPLNLTFETCGETTIPAPDASFDWVVAWSSFEHILDPLSVTREIRRVIRPDGKFFLQLYPFYASEWGSHLERWFPEPFVQFRLSDEEVVDAIMRHPTGTDQEKKYFIQAYLTLNKITLDDLHQVLITAGFWVAKIELLTNTIHQPAVSHGRSLTDLLTNGVKLIAIPS